MAWTPQDVNSCLQFLCFWNQFKITFACKMCKKHSLQHFTTSTSLDCVHRAGWERAVGAICVPQQNSRFIRLAYIYLVPNCSLLWAYTPQPQRFMLGSQNWNRPDVFVFCYCSPSDAKVSMCCAHLGTNSHATVKFTRSWRFFQFWWFMWTLPDAAGPYLHDSMYCTAATWLADVSFTGVKCSVRVHK